MGVQPPQDTPGIDRALNPIAVANENEAASGTRCGDRQQAGPFIVRLRRSEHAAGASRTMGRQRQIEDTRRCFATLRSVHSPYVDAA